MFELIEFESYDTFSHCIGNDLFLIKEDAYILIPIKKMSDYWNMLKVFNETNICERCIVYLVIREQEILDKVFGSIVDKTFSIMFGDNLKLDIGKYWRTENGRSWISKNRIVKEVNIDADHYDEQINNMICTFNEENIRFFWMKFDYVSFDEFKFKELHKLRFWLNNLKNWRTKNKWGGNPIEIIASQFRKSVFVSDNLVLYMSNKKKEDVWFFNLGKHLKENGESIPMKKLNILRKYIDLTTSAIYSSFKIYNWLLVDFEQCKEIQGSLNEIPVIMGLINKWLYDF
jgi:hypothetical protein